MTLSAHRTLLPLSAHRTLLPAVSIGQRNTS
jgi:hypothetical protein